MSERTAFPGLSYEGMTCLVTGAASGIGLETAMTFADLGASVAVLDWTAGAAAATAKKIEKMGRRAVAFEGDAGDEKTVVEAFEATKRTLGPVDVAVACAGVLGAGGPVFTTSVDDFEIRHGRECSGLVPACARGGEADASASVWRNCPAIQPRRPSGGTWDVLVLRFKGRSS